MNEKQYQIRYAGGSYWLLDMDQDGLNYKIPPSLNETGMYIYTKLHDGMSTELIAEQMHDEFGISNEQALGDIKVFIDSMIQKGIIREG